MYEEQHESCEEQQNDSCEKHNESIRKSSGFSSFSSLLSSSDHQILGRTRSSSLPSNAFPTSSFLDSANYSYDGRSDDHGMPPFRSKSFIEKMTNYKSHSPQSSTTCIQDENPINDEKEPAQVEERFTKSEIIESNGDAKTINKELKRKSGLNLLRQSPELRGKYFEYSSYHFSST